MKPTVLFSCIIIASIGCSSVFAAPKKKRHQYNCQAQTAKAIARYNKRAYEEVKTILDEVRMQCGGSSIIDTVRYYRGMANLKTKSYLDAQSEFDQVVQNYPNSVYAEEAHFRQGQCSFFDAPPYDRDQTKTNDAIRQLGEFIDLYPSSGWADSAKAYLEKCNDKLAHKEFASARFYSRIHEYEAAVIYYKLVISDFPASAYLAESKLYLAESLAQVNRVSESLALLDEIGTSSYSSDIVQKAMALRSKLKASQ